MCVGILPARTYLYHMHIALTRTKRGRRILGTKWRNRRLWAALWVLGIKLGPPGRAGSALRRWAVSPAAPHTFYLYLDLFGLEMAVENRLTLNSQIHVCDTKVYILLCLAKVSLLNLGTSIRNTSTFPKCPSFEMGCWYVAQARQLLNLWLFCLSTPPSGITDVRCTVCLKIIYFLFT